MKPNGCTVNLFPWQPSNIPHAPLTHTHTHTHTCILTLTHRHTHVNIYIYSGENKYLNPCRFRKFPPLAKKCVIYNCNGRCILTVRNRISTNKSRKLHFITFMTLFVFDAENKYLNPQANSKNSGSQ